MKFCLLISAIFNFTVSIAQVTSVTQAPFKSVYALVVGISDYENPGIPKLSFAHKDAEAFAAFLKSARGGNIPESNIRLLLNKNATFSAIYEAMNWLQETVNEGDIVYFYFSGHGDMENKTIYKMGFLLSYDTPKSNYINNAVSIEYLNAFANTLSVSSNANVILITDACHSGKLSGSDFRGNMLAGEQLRAVKAKEIRISSCETDQLSAEDEGWGGGRGVFSYYFLNGLEGRADETRDGFITVNEIEKYLRYSMSSDALLAQKSHQQTPRIIGNKDLKLAKVTVQVGNANIAPAVAQSFLKPLNRQPHSYFFSKLDSIAIEEIYDFEHLNKIPTPELPLAFIKHMPSNLKLTLGDTRLKEIESELSSSEDALKRFTNKLAVHISDKGQKTLNSYLEGNEAELERLRYYNIDNNGYDKYKAMFEVAIKLTKPGSYLANVLEVKKHYFEAVALRLKIPTTSKPLPLIDSSLDIQLKALEIEENAAYIHNELGVLYLLKNDLERARSHLTRATQIAPKWGIPVANLAELYFITNDQKSAKEFIEKAIELQPGYQGNYITQGMIIEKEKNLLLAEELYHKSIYMNSRHYLPFERLAHIYLSRTDYSAADSFFNEADKRKKGFYFLPNTKMLLPTHFPDADGVDIHCFFDQAHVLRSPILGNFTWGVIAYINEQYDVAEEKLRKTIELDRSSPLAYHYLGELLMKQKRYREADEMLKKAVEYYLSPQKFEKYLAQLINKSPRTGSDDCFKRMYETKYYERASDHYLLGIMYEDWGYYTLAEHHFKMIISMDSLSIGGYSKLWKLYEQTARYHDAENTIRKFINIDKAQGNNAMNAFYARMITRFHEDRTLYYRAGNFLYDLASEAPHSFRNDQKELLPDDKGEDFLLPLPVPSPIVFSLPVLNLKIHPDTPILRPMTMAIKYLKVADSLYETDEMLAEINQKIGDLYSWQGLGIKAIPHYRKSVNMQPGNANTRVRLIETTSEAYYLTSALTQLDSLENRKQMNYRMQFLYAKLLMHSSRFKEAFTVLKSAEGMYPFADEEIIALKARLSFLEANFKDALNIYLLLDKNYKDPSYQYSIARIYAFMKNNAAALEWLKKAVAGGFDYTWVLKEDWAWKELRASSQWKTITAKLSPRVYNSRD